MFTRNHVRRSTRPWRTSALVLGVTVGALLLAEPALAAHWGPLSSSYKGKVRVQGEGDFYKYQGAYARSTMKITDKSNDGNNVYGKTQFQFYRVTTGSSSPSWIVSATKSTPEHAGAGVARTTSLQVGLRGDADRARGVTQACAQMGWPVPDSCSDSAYTTFSY